MADFISGFPPYQQTYEDKRTREIIEEELEGNVERWKQLPMQLPLDARVMLRLEEVNPYWRGETDLVLNEDLLNSQKKLPLQKKSRRGRRKKMKKLEVAVAV